MAGNNVNFISRLTMGNVEAGSESMEHEDEQTHDKENVAIIMNNNIVRNILASSLDIILCTKESFLVHFCFVLIIPYEE